MKTDAAPAPIPDAEMKGNDLAIIADAEKLPADMRDSLLATFSPLYDKADKLVIEAASISVTEGNRYKR
jgi:hypothetical protein